MPFFNGKLRMSFGKKRCLCWLCWLLLGGTLPWKAQGEETTHFHGIVASGYAWSMKADIRNIDYGYWADAEEGYNASLGNAPFFMLGVGYRFLQKVDVDFTYTVYGTFHYQKQQTDERLDHRTRYFDLNHQGAIFNISCYPHSFSCSQLEWTPFAGGGIGVGTSQISQFHTVFYTTSNGVGSTTSIGSPTTKNAFAWQAMVGFRLRPKNSRLSLDLAYRYYNGGTFQGPSEIVNYSGVHVGGTEQATPWKGTFQTNQLYFALHIAI